MDVEKILRFIQRFAGNRVFEPNEGEKGLVDNWRDDWIEYISSKHTPSKPVRPGGHGGGGQRLSHFTMIEIQNEVHPVFPTVIPEKQVEPVFSPAELGGRLPDLRFDLFLPEESAAIEICMSAISHEWEKDILKALADKKTRILRVLVRRLVSGGGYYSARFTESPSGRMWRALASVYKLDVLAIDLVG